jgi:hypothetical protein
MHARSHIIGYTFYTCTQRVYIQTLPIFATVERNVSRNYLPEVGNLRTTSRICSNERIEQQFKLMKAAEIPPKPPTTLADVVS